MIVRHMGFGVGRILQGSSGQERVLCLPGAAAAVTAGNNRLRQARRASVAVQAPAPQAYVERSDAPREKDEPAWHYCEKSQRVLPLRENLSRRLEARLADAACAVATTRSRCRRRAAQCARSAF